MDAGATTTGRTGRAPPGGTTRRSKAYTMPTMWSSDSRNTGKREYPDSDTICATLATDSSSDTATMSVRAVINSRAGRSLNDSSPESTISSSCSNSSAPLPARSSAATSRWGAE